MTNASDFRHQGANLFLSQDEWEELPARCKDPWFARIAERNERGLAHIDRLLAPTGLSPERSDVPCRTIKVRLQRAAAAWYLTRDERRLRAVEECVDWLLETANWHITIVGHRLEHFDLNMGDLLYCAVFAADVCGAYLCEARVRGLVERIIDPGLAEYVAGIEAGEWWSDCDFNWSSATHGNAGLAALLLRDSHPGLSAAILERARRGLRIAIDALPAGGGYIEGPMYQVTLLAHLTDFVLAHLRVTGDDLGLTGNDAFARVLDSRMYMIGGDGRPINVSDCGEDIVEYFFPGTYWWARRLDRPDWAGFEDRHLKPETDVHGLFHDVETFWYRSPFQESEPPSLDRLKHFGGLDWVKWTGRRSWLLFRGGSNAGNHNNLDLGHFVYGTGADRFLVDPGYGAVETSRHNAVTIEGREQLRGANAPIVLLEKTDVGLYLVCDLSGCYPEPLERHVRHLLLDDEYGLVVIDDVEAGAEPMLPSFHVQTRLPSRVTGGELTIEGSGGSLAVRFVPALPPPERVAWEWRGLPVTSFNWQPGAPLRRLRQAVLLTPDAAGATVVFEADRARVVIASRVYSIDCATGGMTTAADQEEKS